ncbi:MAG: hypothetical protein WDN03_08360 [Rhizomicrobium sp.]
MMEKGADAEIDHVRHLADGRIVDPVFCGDLAESTARIVVGA